MKTFMLLTLLAFSGWSALAANTIDDYTDSVAAELMVRQVLKKNLLPVNSQNLNADLRRALEGSGNSKTRNTITKITCDRGLGSDYCLISVVGEIQGDEGYSFDLRVRVYQGAVISAAILNFIG